MLNEFCLSTGTEERVFEEKWSKSEGLLFKYAPHETKKSVKLLFRQYQSEEHTDEGMYSYMYTCVCLQYMVMLLTSIQRYMLLLCIRTCR